MPSDPLKHPLRFATPVALSLLLLSQGCVALEFLGGRCTQEQLVVTLPATLTRGITTSTVLLTATLTPSNVDKAQFDALRNALVDGSSTRYRVTWTLPAFDTNGGYVAFTHEMPVTNGQTIDIGATFTGGGWGAAAAVGTAPRPAIAVRAENFIATSASGSITVLDTSPVRFRIDVTTRNDAGETIRIAGEAGFAYQKVTKTCID